MSRKEYNKNNNIKSTVTSVFILPMIGLTRDMFLDNKTTSFINGHIKNNLLVIIMDNNHNHEVKLIGNSFYLFKETFDTEILYFYEIPNLPDTKLILEGKYSEISEAYKKVLIDVYGNWENKNSSDVTVKEILYPTDNKRKLLAEGLDIKDITVFKEVFTKPDLEIENLKYLTEL